MLPTAYARPAGSGVDLSIDAMASGPYGMLLSNVDVGYGSRFWGPQVLTTTDVASFMTAWNVKSQVKVRGGCHPRLAGCWPVLLQGCMAATLPNTSTPVLV